ncbi:hypothetical protein niasHS_016314 [Heterodera schachtii]|uniref:Uncharacterized protein n=1 Tax=Heterodera schachtii TaxID=97005 RepID=A0ABD2HTI3_HETSC
MGLVANADYAGTILRSPFNFQPFNVPEISITANGLPYPQAPYDLDHRNGKYVRPFNDMNEAVEFANSTENNGITFAQYGRTHCIYVFNLGDDQVALFDLIKNGTTAVSIKFNQPLPVGGIMLVVMGECDSLVMCPVVLCFMGGSALLIKSWLVPCRLVLHGWQCAALRVIVGYELYKFYAYLIMHVHVQYTKVKSRFSIEDVPADPEKLLAGIFQYSIDTVVADSHERGIRPTHLGCLII